MTDIEPLIRAFRADQPGPAAAPAAVAAAAKARREPGGRLRRARTLIAGLSLVATTAGIAGVLVLSLPRGPASPPGGAGGEITPRVADLLHVGDGIVDGQVGVEASTVVRVLAGTTGGARVELWQGEVRGGGVREGLLENGFPRYVSPGDCGTVPRGTLGICFDGGLGNPYISGVAGRGVASVSVVGAGREVRAVVANGRFVAVHPPSWTVVTVIARDPRGEELFRTQHAREVISPGTGTTRLEDGSSVTVTRSGRVTVRDRAGAVVSDSRCAAYGYPYLETVERLAGIQSAARARNRTALSFDVAYPLSVAVPGRPPLRVASRAALLARLDAVLDDAVLERIGAADPRKLFCRAEGVMLGDGVAWLQNRGGRLRIISLSG